jgi:hypothetical protein
MNDSVVLDWSLPGRNFGGGGPPPGPPPPQPLMAMPNRVGLINQNSSLL